MQLFTAVLQTALFSHCLPVILQVVYLLESVVHDQARQHYRSFFSSVLGGITTNPALMTVHIDDHMVHRCVQRSG